jgi:hypothetical protein
MHDRTIKFLRSATRMLRALCALVRALLCLRDLLA